MTTLSISPSAVSSGFKETGCSARVSGRISVPETMADSYPGASTRTVYSLYGLCSEGSTL